MVSSVFSDADLRRTERVSVCKDVKLTIVLVGSLLVSAPFVIHFKTLDAPVAFYSRHFRSKCDYKLDLQQS